MQEDIFDRHDREWEEHGQQWLRAWNQMQDDETQIREAFASSNGVLPQEWESMIQRNRKCFEQEWSAGGVRETAIFERQQREKNEELKRFYESLSSGCNVEHQEGQKPQTDMYGPYTAADIDDMYRRHLAEEAAKEGEYIVQTAEASLTDDPAKEIKLQLQAMRQQQRQRGHRPKM